MILSELKKNAKVSINDLAKKLSFSRQKVWRVVKNLEENRTILGYTAIINEAKQGRKTFILLIKRTTHPLDKELANKIISRELEIELAKVGCTVIGSIYTNGIYDWVLVFSADELKNAKIVSELFLKRYPKHIQDTTLLEELFPCKVQNILNPDIKDLNQLIG
jgi:DNA-binding Lrp family transcriptional regulator